MNTTLVYNDIVRTLNLLTKTQITAIFLIVVIFLTALMLKYKQKAKPKIIRNYGSIQVDIGEFGLEARLLTEVPLGEILTQKHIILKVEPTDNLRTYLDISGEVQLPD